MERLTKWIKDNDRAWAVAATSGPNAYEKCLTQLAKYEDTGLTPDDLRAMDNEYQRLATEVTQLRNKLADRGKD